jgi:adenine phosphoribosyltransferase
MPEIFLPYDSFGHQKRMPMRFEADVFECEVEGTIPPELEGAYYRTGGDRQYPSLEDDIILNGDGMASMFRFENGHVSFRSRYVQTERLKREREARQRLYGHYRNRHTDHESVSNLPQRDNTGNTYAFNHHGELFMLREDSRPYRLDPETLETIEVGQFGALASTALTAHPKIDPKTGEWWSYGVFARGEPTTDANLHVFDRGGRLIREEWFHTPYPGLSHDWGVTREHLVFPIMPLLADSEALHETVERLGEFAEPREPHVVLGAEARGFILGAALAYRLGCGFVPARKPGKLPWRTISAKYALEYGFDALELHADAISPGMKVLIHDDLLATGGTARAKIDLVEQLGGTVVGLAFVIELEFLNGREKLEGYEVFSLIQYSD